MNLSNQIVPIYVLSENNVDLFYKKYAFILFILKEYLVKFSLSSYYLSCLIMLYLLYIALTVVGDQHLFQIRLIIYCFTVPTWNKVFLLLLLLSYL